MHAVPGDSCHQVSTAAFLGAGGDDSVHCEGPTVADSLPRTGMGNAYTKTSPAAHYTLAVQEKRERGLPQCAGTRMASDLSLVWCALAQCALVMQLRSGCQGEVV